MKLESTIIKTHFKIVALLCWPNQSYSINIYLQSDLYLEKIHLKSPNPGPETPKITFPISTLPSLCSLCCSNLIVLDQQIFLLILYWGGRLQQLWRPHQDPAETTLLPWLKISFSETEYALRSLELSFYNTELCSMLSINRY